MSLLRHFGRANLFVLVDVDDVDDVPAAAGPPVHVDLEARLPAVLQHLQRVLGPTLPARALQHLIEISTGNIGYSGTMRNFYNDCYNCLNP